ncbi:isoleucine--tRNA ligase [Candidatus Woesearchaeota archaeon]|nr:isoleucine--tRNA ligase [Candidatus Woesearchaeota archaeon]
MGKPYLFKEVEESVLKFWKDHKIYEKSKEKNKNGEPFYFLQGPPYTSGKLHMGHAWNNSLKDVAMRFKRMKGFDVWDRAGYDMHGLPTERKVMEKHKIKAKEDIEKFGVEKFIKECMVWSIEKAKMMNEDLARIGIWMDYENAYMPIENDFIDGEWLLVKRAHEQNRLYEGDKTLTWCPVCATAMAKHECEYKNVREESIFLKFKVKAKKNEFLIIWTTTPWTIMFNLAIMVNPEIDYQKCKVGDEVWIIAKPLANVFIGAVAGKTYDILEEMKGAKLEGTEYEHPWFNRIAAYKEIKKKHPKAHTVVLSEEYVDTSAGSGLVHCAPGCGPEDYEVGYRNNLPPFNTLDEYGVFPKDAGEFAGLVAKKDDKKFIEALKKDGNLIAVSAVEHDYPHCERCHTPAIFRKTKQWFFKVEDLKDSMVKHNQDVYWIPKAGQNAFNSWLENLRDNSISKQRYWGTPVPIWKCTSPKCTNYEVIGSIAELEKRAGVLPQNLHKPWIDNVTLKCECGGTMKRVPDILDVWIDAGTASWSCLYYPTRQDLFERFFPADFILEAKEQVRGWFNMLMVASMIAFKRPSFSTVYMHGMLTDVEGQKMSKSLGNVISPYELIDKHGADTLRYYMCETKPGLDINFSWDDVKLKFKNLQVLWNVQNYLVDLCHNYGLSPRKIDPVDADKLDLEESYLLSRIHSTIKVVSEMHEMYFLNEITQSIEGAFLDLSRDYIQFIRDKEDKQKVVDTLYASLVNIMKMMAPSMPFISESIYQNLKASIKGSYGLDAESVHLSEWPGYDKKLINPALEEEMRVTKQVITLILAKREEEKVGVRWPLARAEIVVDNPVIFKKTEALIMKQTNIKKLLIKKGDVLKVELDIHLTPSLEAEGFAREIARRVQALRKNAGLQKNDKVDVIIVGEVSLDSKMLDDLKEKVGAKDLLLVKESDEPKAKFEASAKIRDKEFRFIVKK